VRSGVKPFRSSMLQAHSSMRLRLVCPMAVPSSCGRTALLGSAPSRPMRQRWQRSTLTWRLTIRDSRALARILGSTCLARFQFQCRLASCFQPGVQYVVARSHNVPITLVFGNAPPDPVASTLRCPIGRQAQRYGCPGLQRAGVNSAVPKSQWYLRDDHEATRIHNYS
jgi:hypothetical protein